MSPDELIAVIERGLSEDEQTAREASPGPWESLPHDGGPYYNVVDAERRCVAAGTPGASVRRDAAHIARHDPSRVLADVESKREVIRLYRDTVATIETFEHCGLVAAAHEVAAESYLNTLRALARPYLSQETP